LTLFQVGSRDHANHTQQQGSDLEKKMTATSGRKCLEQFEKFNRPGLWARTFAALLIGTGEWYSMKCRLIWKLKATKSHRFYFQLVPSMLPTEEIGFGLLPTPSSMEERTSIETWEARNERNKQKGMTNSKGLAISAKMGLLPTPTSVQRDHPERVEALKATGATDIYSRNNGENRPNSIIDYMNFHGMLPTPTTRDWKDCFQSQEKLNEQYEKRESPGVALTVGYLTGKTSQLNPQFVLEMMGFPLDWTELPFLSGETNPSKEEATP
jgi:hypothetical protein